MERRMRIGDGGRSRDAAVTTRQRLLTRSWTEDVDTLETAVQAFTTHRSLRNDCRVVFFEVAGDAKLHVNVTHEHATIEVRGWDGPGKVADGFVHNRRFGDTPPSQMIREIRDMVFAARI